jgi:hypothetical protein
MLFWQLVGQSPRNIDWAATGIGILGPDNKTDADALLFASQVTRWQLLILVFLI